MLRGGTLLLLLLLLLSSDIQGNVIEGPNNVTYLPGLTPLPIELTCNITGVAVWRIDNVTYTLTQLTNGVPQGHSRIGTNVLVNSPVNNTEYICLSTTNDGETSSDPAYIVIAGVPEMVPDVTYYDNSTNINGNNVTLTLSWGEPFNNFDPIVNYTVSCLGDVTCPPTTTDNTTGNITNLTPMTDYIFSVVATNSIGSGKAGVVMITTLPGLPPINNITVSGTMCFETSVNISWNPSSINTSLFQEILSPSSSVNVTMLAVSYQGMILSTSSKVLFMFSTNNTFYNYNITEFNKSTNYTVRIASVNMLGNGIYNNRTFYIPGQENFTLGTVTIIDAERKINTNLNQTNLIVTWKPLINLFCEVLNYTITLSTTDLTMNINVLSSSTLIAIFPNISNSTEYSITIVAVNRASNGSATLKVIMPIPGSVSDSFNRHHCPCLIFWIILAVIVVIVLIVHTPVGVSLRCYHQECPEESRSCIVLLVILGVLTLGISLLIWYIYLKCQKKTECSRLQFIAMIVSHILAVGIPALLWYLIHPCCIKKKKDKSDTGDTPLTSPNQVKPEIDTGKFTKAVKKTEYTQQQQQVQLQQEYAVVDKSKKMEEPSQKQNTELNYLGPDDLEFKKGPEIRFKTDHTVQYGQFDDTT